MQISSLAFYNAAVWAVGILFSSAIHKEYILFDGQRAVLCRSSRLERERGVDHDVQTMLEHRQLRPNLLFNAFFFLFANFDEHRKIPRGRRKELCICNSFLVFSSRSLSLLVK